MLQGFKNPVGSWARIYRISTEYSVSDEAAVAAISRVRLVVIVSSSNNTEEGFSLSLLGRS